MRPAQSASYLAKSSHASLRVWRHHRLLSSTQIGTFHLSVLRQEPSTCLFYGKQLPCARLSSNLSWSLCQTWTHYLNPKACLAKCKQTSSILTITIHLHISLPISHRSHPNRIRPSCQICHLSRSLSKHTMVSRQTHIISVWEEDWPLYKIAELVSTLEDSSLFTKHPEYKTALKVASVPERIIQFRVVWEDDKGQVQINRGYRVQFN